ncbi:hypothetical protein Tco_0472834 [Tanacetum coccineum]
MHLRKDPSFFLTNKTGAPQGEELGAAPGTKSIWNSTCRAGGIPGKSSGKSLTISTSSSRFPSDFGGHVNQGTKGSRYKAPIRTSIKQNYSITVVEKKHTRNDVRVWASISSSQSISSSLSYAIPASIPMVLQFWAILLDVSGIATFIACPCLLILVVVVIVVGVDPIIIGSMNIPLVVSTLGCTFPSVVVVALGAQR